MSGNNTGNRVYRYSRTWVGIVVCVLGGLAVYAKFALGAGAVLMAMLLLPIVYFLHAAFTKYLSVGEVGVGVGRELVPWEKLKRVEYSHAPMRVVLVVEHYSKTGKLKKRRIRLSVVISKFDEFTEELTEGAKKYAPSLECKLLNEKAAPDSLLAMLLAKRGMINPFVVSVYVLFVTLLFAILVTSNPSTKLAEFKKRHAKYFKEIKFPEPEENAAPLYLGAAHAVGCFDYKTPEGKKLSSLAQKIIDKPKTIFTLDEQKLIEKAAKEHEYLIPLLEEAARKGASGYFSQYECWVHPEQRELRIRKQLNCMSFFNLSFLCNMLVKTYEKTNPTKAAQVVGYLLDITYSMRNELGSVSFVARTSIQEQAAKSIHYLLLKTNLPEDVLLELDSKLKRELATTALGRVMAAEIEDMFYAYAVMRETKGIGFGVYPYQNEYLNKFLPEGIKMKKDENRRMEAIGGVLDVLERYGESRFHPEFHQLNIADGNFSAYLERGMIGIGGTYSNYVWILTCFRARAILQVARGVILVERLERRMGRLPKDVAELEAELGIKMPEDPFGKTKGDSLIYMPTKTGYKIYSIGEDGKDDGGKKLGVYSREDIGFEIVKSASVRP